MFHNHHIIPKHQWRKIHGNLDGWNIKTNKIRLTISEHAEAHKKLWEKNGYEEDRVAWLGLSGMISNEEIIEARQKLPKTEEHKNNLRKAKSKQSWKEKVIPIYSKANTGERNPRAKWYKILTGEREFIVKSLKTFCNDNNHNYNSLCLRKSSHAVIEQINDNTRVRNITQGKYKGWIIYEFKDSPLHSRKGNLLYHISS